MHKYIKQIQDTGETTVGDECTLFWNQRKHTLTAPFVNLDNVVIFSIAPGYDKFTEFFAEYGTDDIDESDPLSHNNIISDY